MSRDVGVPTLLAGFGIHLMAPRRETLVSGQPPALVPGGA
ncbi:hypothetical protein UVI_02009270 [Ustilaginoidea virens]|uniref:Uncharacterized protein n=1 Tax=Ustilaginoidea virens TaxID=1159556 RepID=A0A1B5KX92_USTVR|nr:hypothetical protein UVI_02009270 [Ustilaginoidea virens]